MIFYEVQEGEHEEDGKFVVINETPAEDADDPDAIPVRVLSDFTIFDIDACDRLVPFSVQLGADSSKTYGAAGNVTSWTENDLDEELSEDNDDAPIQRINLRRILEVNIHSVERETKTKLFLDP